ncbi:histidinol dehydrogenase [Niabella insulamsoli]|uniref:histidinol dehydrogenase n=1 Tax=Niabella insulamsoli TaxID=3144874 RepID=UPI0031FD2650
MNLKIYKYPSVSAWQGLCQRPMQNSSAIRTSVDKIIYDVANNGDVALKKYAEKFDGVVLKNILVSKKEIDTAAKQMDPKLKRAILQAKNNIQKFHSSQKQPIVKVETSKGILCWREARAIEKIGLYIPGGSAPLFSTVLMLGIPAMIAKCKEVVLCTPPDKNGKINDAILYAASLCGITKIFKTGGAQAIAAMAYGTKSIPAVFKIFGPGNQFVTAAKQILQTKVAIDMPAGPSELLVIADQSAVPEYVAADLLAQAEHGPDSQVILVCTNLDIARKVAKAVEVQLSQLPRKDIAEGALQHARLIVLKNLNAAVSFSNLYAPEHLILACKVNTGLLKKIDAAGSVFIGNYSPESVGDYASGTNHTLPTNGYATAYSGVSLDSFYKKITFQQLSKDGLHHIAKTVSVMAEAEGLQAHSNAVKIRLS